MRPRPLVLVSGKGVIGTAGGHESYVRAHALAVAQFGFEPHVFCAARRSGTTVADFATVHDVAAPVPVAAQQPLIARAIVRRFRDEAQPVAIHGFALWASAGALAALMLTRGGRRAIPVAAAYATRTYESRAIQDGLADLGRGQRAYYRARYRWTSVVDNPVERWGYARSRAVLVNYESVSRILREAYGDGLAIRRIPYAAAEDFLPPPKTPPRVPAGTLPPGDEPLILAVSRHDPRKGIDVLLRALALLAGEGVRFRACLVGPGRVLAANRRLAAGLGLGERVAIPGLVDEVAPYLASADIFALPSLAEASGSVSIIEALRCGLPVVASSCDGIPEDLTDGEDALLVQPGDPAALAGALRRLIEDPALRRRLGAAGRRVQAERFSADRFAAALRKAYVDVGIL